MTKKESNTEHQNTIDDSEVIEELLKYIKQEIVRSRRHIDALELKVDLIRGKYTPNKTYNPRWVSPFYTGKDDCDNVRIHIGDTVKLLTGASDNTYGIVTKHSKSRVYIRDRTGNETSRASKHLKVLVRRS